MINPGFSSQFPSAYLKYLVRKTSNHCPMVVHFDRVAASYGPHLFRSQNMWCSHEAFLSCVKDVWMNPVSSNGLWKLAEILKKTKLVLRAWNKFVFGRVDSNIKALEECVETLEQQLQVGYSQ